MENAMNDARFFFTASGMPKNAFSVCSFSGDEAMDEGYRFEILLLSKNGEAEKDLATAKLCLGVRRPGPRGGDAVWNGLAESVAYVGGVGHWHSYRVVLVPRAAALRHAVSSRIFMNLALPGMIEDLLKKEGWTANVDFDISALAGTYAENPFACQYNESAFAFISRHMERLGAYSFIRQDAGADCLVFADSPAAHAALPQGDALFFEAPSGLVNPEAARPEEVVFSFSRVLSRQPESIRLLEYNNEGPDVNIDVRSDPVAPDEPRWPGVTLFGEGCRTTDEGRGLARVLGESMACRAQIFEGKSHIPYLRPGYTLTLTAPRRFQGKYTIVSAHHEGSRAAELGASLGFALANDNRPDGYGNTFTCIPAQTQYRAKVKTPRPTIHGVINAVIDVAGEGSSAILDDSGRYTVKFHFDAEMRGSGNSSTALRMMQPYAAFPAQVALGAACKPRGIHFPLYKGAGVLIAFIGGDPDRPVIVGALPNPHTPSPVISKNQTMNVMATPGGHRIEMDDAKDAEALRIVFRDGESFIGISHK